MNSILTELNQVFSAVFPAETITLNATMKTGDITGWDSFKNVEILLECEAHWGFQFTSKEIDKIRTVGDLANTISDKLNA